jgi:short-subunit dehydrogenase
VTGASSGIGLAMARQLAGRGTDLVVVARDRDRLEALADELSDPARMATPVEVEVLVADLADREALDRVADRLAADPPVDLLVNNAGFGNTGDFIDLDRDRETAVVEVNIVALHRLAHAAATVMAPRGRGGILNVSSIAGYLPAPGSATYAATKAFVTSFSEALAAEVSDRGVRVTALCPGLTRTEFHQRASYDASGFPDFTFQTADDVAIAGLDGVDRGRIAVIPGTHNRAVVAGARLIPGRLLARLARRLPVRQPR